MKVDFLANQEGGIWILHDQAMPEILKWVDFDADAHTITFAYQTGKTQELGLPIPANMTERLKKANNISVILVKDGQIRDFALVALNIQSADAFYI